MSGGANFLFTPLLLLLLRCFSGEEALRDLEERDFSGEQEERDLEVPVLLAWAQVERPVQQARAQATRAASMAEQAYERYDLMSKERKRKA